MAQAPKPTPAARDTETMLAEVVHHMAEMVMAQKEANRLLAELVRSQAKG